MEFDKDAGTAVAYLIMKVNDDISINVTIDKETEKVSTIIYTKVDGFKELSVSYDNDVDYDFDTEIDFDDVNVCMGYKLDDDSYINDAAESISSLCKESNNSALKKVKKERDSFLKKHDLSLDDLNEWGNWYYKENK